MNIYLVRQCDRKSILGIFWSESTKDLWWNVDSVTDPVFYEYAKLEQGNLHFPDEEPIAQDWSKVDEGEEQGFDWQSASADGHLEIALHHPKDLKWKRFPDACAPGGGIDQARKAAAQ